jgi:hypothetical protein
MNTYLSRSDPVHGFQDSGIHLLQASHGLFGIAPDPEKGNFAIGYHFLDRGCYPRLVAGPVAYNDLRMVRNIEKPKARRVYESTAPQRGEV